MRVRYHSKPTNQRLVLSFSTQHPILFNFFCRCLSLIVYKAANNRNTPTCTDMDGVDGFTCSLWSDCLGGKEAVFCHGDYGHSYPFWPLRSIEGFRIMWDFMKSHRKDI